MALAIVLGFLAIKAAGDLGHGAWPWACRCRSGRCSRCCWRRAASSPSSCSRPPRAPACFRRETSSLLIGAVARVDAARARCCWWPSTSCCCRAVPTATRSTLDEISEPQDAPIIIAGFGRYGQIIGRMLSAQGIAATVLDHDADMIEAARAFGYKVFYGDATPAGPAAHRRRRKRPRCWWSPSTTSSSRWPSSTWRANTSPTSSWWRARAT